MSGSQYDDIIMAIGDFGPFQKKTYAIFCLPAAIKAAIVMSSIFILSVPEYRCAIPGYENDTYSIQNDFHLQLINSTIPMTRRGHDNVYDECAIYDVIGSAVNLTKARKACDRWVYDVSEISTSIAMEYNFVCSLRIMRSHVNMGFFVGSLVGSVLFGALADLCGRKTSLILCLALQSVSGISQYFVSNLYAIVVLRSLQGMTTVMFAISASTGMELVGPKKRTFAGVMVEFFWVLGLFLVALVAYVTDDWRLFQLVWGLLSLLMVGATCFLPESPRWLLEKGKIEKAEKLLAKIAHNNKAEREKPKKKASVRDLLKTRAIFRRSAIVFFNWFAVNFLYYGLTLSVDNLHGSLYVNYVLAACGEVLSYLICFVLLRFLGRRPSYAGAMVFGAISCLITIFPAVYGSEDHTWTIVLLAILGKVSASICYAILYIMTVELFPTSVRNSVLGLSAIFENISGLICPYIADLGILVGGPLAQALPSLVFGSVSLIAGIASLFLPETKGKPLPENMDELMHEKGDVPKELSRDDAGNTSYL